MGWRVYFGSGRATCGICDKVIREDQLQVNVVARGGPYTVQRNVHLDCLVGLGDDAVAKRG